MHFWCKVLAVDGTSIEIGFAAGDDDVSWWFTTVSAISGRDSGWIPKSEAILGLETTSTRLVADTLEAIWWCKRGVSG